MDLGTHINQLREDLTAAASVGDEDTRHAATLLSGALEPAVRLTLMNALSDLAAEVTTQLDGRVVDVRLEGRDVRAVVSGPGEPRREGGVEDEPPQPPPTGDSGDISRITLRLLDEIKGQAEQAASTQGVSLNTWVARAVQGALHGARPHGSWSGGTEQPGTTEDSQWDSAPSSRLWGWVNG